MKIRIEPYKAWSGGAKALGVRAGILRATKRQVAKHGDFDMIINWGSSQRRFNSEYINDPNKVCIAADKLRTANTFRDKGVPQPEYTTSLIEAAGWVEAGMPVMCRKLLRGSQGRGIVLASALEQVVAAPLYTKYIKKVDEYRVHVAFGKIIDVQQKKRRLEVPDEKVNWQIRNSHNGWVFARDGVIAPSCVRSAARDAVTALGLDFAAVDIGYNGHTDSACVYEVNTAPGLEGTTLERYFRAFSDAIPSLRGGMFRARRYKQAQ